ncbi:putative clathrin assembly protein [Hibiscus syriacus]|uniref:Clathrin assembly protein n=1 Tax=Hibiscus syriacus TaxID=106335 RepID=A0A6A3CTB9_HIBSY|nr:uncharacterized protein LOC120132608 [Hibiscus syriacus]KAE8732795.1 putative clathrin assembly protein [Hibiscus syriacus]
MPRPGPRPYVCERRAWHSDRHQPMRGSLIQEIFRVVKEIHSSATKKNKEWQEKLPVVVLKAEEIMYSKANSEVEYMDLKTLRDRASDAINTIIRRDESTETGELLQPCIEAALHLGCTPRRTSRSQRNSNLRCYLEPETREVDNVARGNVTVNSHCMAGYSGFMKPTTMNVTLFNGAHNKFLFSSENGSLPRNNPCLPIEKYPPNLYSVFPLFYGNHRRFEEPQHALGVFPKLISNTVAPAKTGYIQNQLFSDADSLNKMNQTDLANASNNPHEFACDLSLRLGPLSTPCFSVRNGQPLEIRKNGSTFPETNKFSNKSFSSFLRSKGDDPLNSSSNKRSTEGERSNEDASTRKRKTIYGPAADQQFHLPSMLPYSPTLEDP